MELAEAIQDLEEIRAVAAGLKRTRKGIYILLAIIYRIGLKWLKEKVSKELREEILKSEGRSLDLRTKRSVFRFLIELRYPTKAALKSRYANVLHFARTNHCLPEDLRAFVKDKGGLDDCSKKCIAWRKQRRRS
jgi:hypothetical protein